MGVREGSYSLNIAVHGDRDLGRAAVQEVGRGLGLRRSGNPRRRRRHVLGKNGGVVVNFSSVFVLDVDGAVSGWAAVALLKAALVALDLSGKEGAD